MNLFHRQSNVRLKKGNVTERRDFLRYVSASSIAAGTLSWNDWMSVQAAELRQQGMACILLWMQGGPSQFETFDPKPNHRNGGATKSISTAVSGIKIAENLPETAKVMNDICVIRSMTSKEGSHPRATYLMHTGRIPTASVKYPSVGSFVAQQLGDRQADLPSFVQIGGKVTNATRGGFLGVDYDPFLLTNANKMPNNTSLPTSESRFERRLRLLGRMEDRYARGGAKKEVEDHRKLYGKASRMLMSKDMAAFDLQQEPESVRQAYGEGDFASGCVLARRLVEHGVTFVEVNAGNWDTHNDNFGRTRELCQNVDRAYANLLIDLRERGMLHRTLVVWMGEFGRTPRINGLGGRDHFPKAFNVALAGAGVRGGQVIGATTKGGDEVADDPTKVTDLFRTFCHALKIDPDNENDSGSGRPIRLVDDGEVLERAFS